SRDWSSDVCSSDLDAAARAACQPSHVVGHLEQGTGEQSQSSRQVGQGIMCRQGKELVFGRLERQTGDLRDACGGSFAKTRMGIEPGTDSCATNGQIIDARQGRFHCLQSKGYLGNPTTDFLSQRDWSGVLQMGAPGFDDLIVFVCLVGQSGLQLTQ